MSSQPVNSITAWLHTRLALVPAPLRAAIALIAGIHAADEWRWHTAIPACIAVTSLLLSVLCRRK
ncbi:MAG: hypothetical protein ACKPJJ_21150, partial [Planctomycetaceae bacterium]